MRKLAIITVLLSLFFTSVQAQQKFDSAAYVQQFKKIFPAFSLDTARQNDELSIEQKIEGLSKVWYEAKFNFANFDLVPQLNWDSAYRAFIPRVLATHDILSYYGELKKFNQLLHDGHSRVVEPLYYFMKKGMLPFVFEFLDGKVILSSVLSHDPEYTRAQIGWIATAIEGVPIQDYIKKTISPYLHFSTPQDSISRIYRYELCAGKLTDKVSIRFITKEGKEKTLSFKRMKIDFDEDPVQFKLLPGNIGHVTINSFNTPKTVAIFDSLFPQISKTSALIIDIRSNGGGNSNNGYEIIGYLVNKPFYTNISVMRMYRPSYRAWGSEPVTIELNKDDWKPYKNKLYSKPVVVITGPATYSAAEDFTGAFKTTGRGKIVGATTGGSTGQPLGYKLPGGGLGFVCSKRDVLSDGTEFVGIGIKPDVEIHPTIQGIQQGRDEVLEKAVEVLKTQE